jgi:hypothetical protein
MDLESNIFINLTPHPVRIGNKSFSPSGVVARMEEEYFMSTSVKEINMSNAIGLPPKEKGKVFIVSLLVAIAKQDRDDLVVPMIAVRDANTRQVIANQDLAKIIIKYDGKK